MPGTGCSTRAILTRRLRAGTLRTGVVQDIETFCAEQLDRIERIADHQIKRARTARRRLAERAIARAGCELEVHVRGLTGSDAHVDDADTPALV